MKFDKEKFDDAAALAFIGLVGAAICLAIAALRSCVM